MATREEIIKKRREENEKSKGKRVSSSSGSVQRGGESYSPKKSSSFSGSGGSFKKSGLAPLDGPPVLRNGMSNVPKVLRPPSSGSNRSDPVKSLTGYLGEERTGNLDGNRVNRGRQGGETSNFSGTFGMSPEDEILAKFEELLGQQFDRQPIDTSYLTNALNAKLGAINTARGEANQFAETSGSNLQNMYDAFQGNVRGRQAGMQESGDAAQADVASVFDKTIAEANARKESGNAQREEMLSRLGIAGAANAPDLANQAIEEGITNSQGSRDNRVTEIEGGTQRGIQNNGMFADALGAEGLQRQADLQRQLQGVLGGLSDSEVSAQSDYANAMMGVQGDQQDRDYQQWLSKMAMGQQNLDSFIGMNDQAESRAFDASQQSEQNASDFALQQMKAQSEMQKSANQGMQGFSGLRQSTDPAVQNAFVDVISQPGADTGNVADLVNRMRTKYPQLDPQAVLQFVTEYNQLGTQKTFGQ